MAKIDETDEKSVASEQIALNKHDGEVDILSIHIQRLLAATNQ